MEALANCHSISDTCRFGTFSIFSERTSAINSSNRLYPLFDTALLENPPVLCCDTPWRGIHQNNPFTSLLRYLWTTCLCVLFDFNSLSVRDLALHLFLFRYVIYYARLVFGLVLLCRSFSYPPSLSLSTSVCFVLALLLTLHDSFHQCIYIPHTDYIQTGQKSSHRRFETPRPKHPG
jgi:hypothetical protein